jgi:hypothetical protein
VIADDSGFTEASYRGSPQSALQSIISIAWLYFAAMLAEHRKAELSELGSRRTCLREVYTFTSDEYLRMY